MKKVSLIVLAKSYLFENWIIVLKIEKKQKLHSVKFLIHFWASKFYYDILIQRVRVFNVRISLSRSQVSAYQERKWKNLGTSKHLVVIDKKVLRTC